MATFLQAADRMPTLSGSSEKDVKALHDYVYSLQEALRYVLGNLGEENLDSELLESIKQSGKFASEIRQRSDEIELRVEELGESVASLDISVGAIDARVESAEDGIAELSIRADGISSRVTTAQNRADSAYSEAVDAWWAASEISQKVDNITLKVEDRYGSTYIKLTSEGVQIGDSCNVTSIVDGVISTKTLVAEEIQGNIVYIYDDEGSYYGDIEVATDSGYVSALALWGNNGLRLLSGGNIFLGANHSSGYTNGPNITVSYETGRISLQAVNGVWVNGRQI